MNTRYIPIIIGIMLGINLIFNPVAQAADEAERVHIPATVTAIWQAIDLQNTALDKAIRTEAFAEVDPRAFAIRDLVAALPAHAGHLSPDKLTQLKATVQFIAIMAERLDTTGDAKDKAGTESNFKKMQGILKTLRSFTLIQKGSNSKRKE